MHSSAWITCSWIVPYRYNIVYILYMIIFWRILLSDNEENLLESDVDLSENYADLSYVISICQKIMPIYHICYVDLSENYPNLSNVMSTCQKKYCQLDGSNWAWTHFTVFFKTGKTLDLTSWQINSTRPHKDMTYQHTQIASSRWADTSTYPDSKQSLGWHINIPR